MTCQSESRVVGHKVTNRSAENLVLLDCALLELKFTKIREVGLSRRLA